MKIKKEQLKIANLKIEIAEIIGELKGEQTTINGKQGQAIIDAFSLIKFLQRIQKEI